MRSFTKFKKLSFIAALCAGIFLAPSDVIAKAKTKKVSLSTETGAKIFVDGKLLGTATAEIKVAAYTTVNVRVEKIGFITEERNLINDDTHDVPKTVYIKMEADDAYEQSFTTDVANHDIDIRTNQKEDDAWKLISRIITNSFDVIQVTDKATGYMCTAWTVKNFRSATVRSRLIIKTGSTDPLIYKAKLVSEIGKPGVSGNQDENFKPWDRVLRTYENVISDMQSRLGK